MIKLALEGIEGGSGERSSPEQKGFHHSGSVDVMCAIELVQNSESGLIVLYLITLLYYFRLGDTQMGIK